MNPQNMSIIAVAPDGIGRAITSESSLRDLLKSNVKKRKSRWEEDKTTSSKRGKFKGTRWGPDEEKTFTPQPFSYLPNLPQDELEILIRRHRLDDLQRRLAIADYESNDPDLRSLSPEPIYDKKTGVRANTREIRTKEKYNKEKEAVIEELLKLDPSFAPPADFKPSKKIKKLFIPDADSPSCNVVGLIIGQKGQNQRLLEQKSGCKISIRGKGASRGKIYNRAENDENEPLHVLIQGDTEDNIKKAVELIEPIINPYEDPDKRKSHLLQLALRNVLHDEYCENCGERGHKMWDCPNKLGNGWKKPDICCALCKDRGHPTSDCPLKRAGVNNSSEIGLYEDFRRFMMQVKGSAWEMDTEPRALTYRDDKPAIEYTGTGNYDNTVEALSKNINMNTTLKPPAAPGQQNRPLAIADAPAVQNNPQTAFKGTTGNIVLENIIMLDANGYPIGSTMPEGSVTNPLMNPIYAAMYAPYLSSYNYMMQNPNAYYSSAPQAGGNSSLAGVPQTPYQDEGQPPPH